MQAGAPGGIASVSPEACFNLANFDSLTGLPNRSLLGDRTLQAIAHAKRAGRPAVLLVVNLDRFKLVNETFGHASGDSLLRLVAERLRGSVCEGDTVARLGADTFAMLASDLERANDVLAVVRKIRESMRTPYAIEGGDLFVTVSLGASVYPRDGEEFDILLRNAAAAMVRCKAKGGNGLQFYAMSMTRQAADRATMENELGVAIGRNELELHYQPQIVLADRRIAGVEALMRWNRHGHGWVSPAQFLPVAEDSDLIQSLGEFALSGSCRALRAWGQSGFGSPRLAVNVSARQFRAPGFVDSVERNLEESGLDPVRLELELTEESLAQNRDESIAILKRLKTVGVQVAVDDFGTSESSLSQLSRMPIDCLKIDRSFVAKVQEHGHAALIAQAVISLAQSLGLRVIAEGIESAEQLEFLRERGCEQGQGFLFSPAVDAEAMAQLLAAGAMKPA